MFNHMIFHNAKVVHRWMGAILALLLVLIGVTGVLLIWKDAYIRYEFSDNAEAFEHSINSMSNIALKAEQAFGADSILRIEFGDKQLGLSKAYLLNSHASYIAPDGKVLASWGNNERLEDWLLDLHHRLLSGTIGLYIVGFSGIATTVLVLAGLMAYWPLRKGWRQGLRLRGLKRAALLSAHRNTGLLLALPIVLVVITGVSLSFPDTSRSLFFWFNQNNDNYGEDFGDGVDNITGADQATWPEVIARAAAVFPNAQITGLVWPSGTGIKQVLLRNNGEWSERGYSSVHITEVDGYMDIRIDARTLPLFERALNIMNPLHRSGLGGLTYNVIQTLVGTGIIFLGIIGLLAFTKKTIFSGGRRTNRTSGK